MRQIAATILIFSILIVVVRTGKQLRYETRIERSSGQPLRIQPRVWHGKVTPNGILGGFAVQIFYVEKLICTGTLLSRRHFISAAHCFENLKLGNLHVVAGETLQRREFPPSRRKNFLVKLKIHPDFSKFKFIADIAVAKTKLVMKSKYIGYAGICSVRLYPTDKVTVAGWGVSDHKNQTARNPLRTMRISIVSKVECEKKLNKIMPANVLCASAYNGQTLCSGDSGGPLIFRDQVCGVSTWTWKCGEDKKPDVYMSVLYYAKFIKATIREFGD